MELEKQIQADMVSAMKAKEAGRLASLRAIKAAILLAKTAEGATGEVSDQDIVKLIQKLVSSARKVQNSTMQPERRSLLKMNWRKLHIWKSIFLNSCQRLSWKQSYQKL